MKLFDGQTEDAEGTLKVTHGGGYGSFFANGTFGSGTATLQWSPNSGADWYDVPDSDLTEEGMVTVNLPPGQVRATLDGSTSAELNAGFLSNKG